MKCDLLAIDVSYSEDNKAFIVGISTDKNETSYRVFTAIMDNVEPYISGQFYKRELPCIETLIDTHKIEPEILIVDAFCKFNSGDCLGAIFHNKHKQIKVIGVAKNAHKDMLDDCELVRGKRSTKPLYVTSSGIDSTEAKNIIRQLKGDARLPFLLKEVDSLTKKPPFAV